MLLAELERYEEAITCYDRALEIQPDLSRAWDNRGEALDKLGRYQEAFASFDEALQYQPDVAEIWNHQGNALKKVNPHDALPSFDRAIELKPYFVAAIANRGNTYRLLSRYEEALQDFNRAIEIEHQEAWLFVQRGQVFLEIEQYEEALIDFNHAIELDSHNAHVFTQRGQALAAIERYEEARQNYEQALAIFREKGDVLNEAICLSNLGNTYQELNENQEAIKYFQASLEISRKIEHIPNQAITLSSLGKVYDSVEEYSQAIEYYQQALSVYRSIGHSHGESWVLVNLADTYQALDNHQESIDAYEQALAISQQCGYPQLEVSIQTKLTQALFRVKNFERAIAVAQSIPDQEKRLEVLTGVIEEGRRFEGDQTDRSLLTISDALTSVEITDPSPETSLLPFTSGTFTVGESNTISIDYLFDGGGYQGQVAIFSLDGMDQFEPGSTEFVQEAASRALSNSELGYVVISDMTEGSRFSNPIGEANQNEEAFLGAKSGFTVKSGGEYALMLAPNSSVYDVLQNPNVGGDKRPWFSIANANPKKTFQIGRAVDLTGAENTFSFEDLRLDGQSDRDYNDIIFQVRGTRGNAAQMDDLVAPNRDITQIIFPSQLVFPSQRISYDLSLMISSDLIIVGEEVEAVICLDSENSRSNNAYLLSISRSETVGSELNVLLSASGFRFEGDNVVSLPLDLTTNSKVLDPQQAQTACFRLTALRPGAATITAEIYRGDTFETTLEKIIQVVGLEELSFLDNNIKSGPRPVSQPDLNLQVQTLWNETASTCSFRYYLRSFRASSLLCSGITYQSQPLPGFWLQQVHELLQNALETVSDAFPADGRSHLTSLGHYLFQQLFPIELQTDLRNLNRYQALTLMILADQDAQFPWTLLHNGQEFLGERFILGHWLWDLNNTQPYEFPVGAINVAHYANVEQPEVWATLLEPPGAPPPYILTGGVLDDLGSMEAMRGLHLIRLGQSAADAERQYAPVPLDIALEEQNIDQKVRPIKLNLRRNRPLVTLGYLRQDQPELTSLQQTWAATFIRAGCSAFVGTLWAVNPATEAAFISSFYHALWTGDSLGEAFQTARRLARATTPDSLDWLAYLLFGDPMARPYRPVQGQGYAVVEPIGQDIDDPVPPGTTIRFRVSLRRTPPVWHEERVIEVAENLTFNDLQAHIVTFGLQVTPATSIPLRLTPSGNYLGWFNLSVPSEIAGDAALVQVYFADGMQTIHTLTFPLTFQSEGGHPA